MSVMSLAVVAVVVTHNRRELLVECLEALFAQTVPVARVHVVDNASTDGTRELLAERGLLGRPDVHYELQERNLGGAGGFSRGVELGREGADWVWLMDDDAEPEPDCLQKMLESAPAGDERTAALCSRVVGADGRLQALHRGRLDGRPAPLEPAAYGQAAPEIGFATFVGLLVRGAVARALDPPKAEFFLWVDDYEYCVRLRKRGRLHLVPASTIRHKDRAPSFSTRRARFFNRVLGWEYHATPYEGAWRNFFGIRNYVWMKQEHEGLSDVGFAAVVAQFAIKALMYDEKPLKRIPWLIRYARDGRRGHFVNMDPGEWVARARRGA
jgi:GT2 family glycosyltransferase